MHAAIFMPAEQKRIKFTSFFRYKQSIAGLPDFIKKRIFAVGVLRNKWQKYRKTAEKIHTVKREYL